MIAVVRPGVGERPEWAPLWTAWGRQVGGWSVQALRVAGASHLPRGSLLCRGPLALVPRGPVRRGLPPGMGGPDGSDVVLEQGLSDAEGSLVVHPPMYQVWVAWGIGPHVRQKAGGHIPPLA